MKQKQYGTNRIVAMEGMEHISLTPIENSVLLEACQTLPLSGPLRINAKGFVYVTLHDDYIHKLHPLLQQALPYYVGKPNYFEPPKDVGAHISVLYDQEVRSPIRLKPYLDQTVSFEINQLCRADFEEKQYFCLTVNAPKISELRANLSLPTLLQYKNVMIPPHITIGKRIL